MDLKQAIVDGAWVVKGDSGSFVTDRKSANVSDYLEDAYFFVSKDSAEKYVETHSNMFTLTIHKLGFYVDP